MNLKEFLEPDRESTELEWAFAQVAFFVMGGLWAIPLYQRMGVEALEPFILTGVLLAGMAFCVGRASRYATRLVRLRSDNAGVSPVVATVLMVAITVLLAIVLYLMVSHFLGI